ncbi:hypothetical protein M885DRAFT_522139 [Pelagophyceae sp. CCMP2097]|nr:hypothetical protein M885DRAFT_522139 [Pelagophyceae sp. CCMP2097]|mmetsp:Transcript_5452/g.19312  ORF Transcript_5452/g.19312 Transcript_5452/m.19312 type:complete len:143 (-) Transcript_5452:92-520(-)
MWSRLLILAGLAYCEARFTQINAVTVASNEPYVEAEFFVKLGFQLTYNTSDFCTVDAADFHVNIFKSDFAPAPVGTWNGWGRAIIYVDEPASVDAVYDVGVANGLVAEAPPADAEWGERYFQILSPMGHEFAISARLPGALK